MTSPVHVFTVVDGRRLHHLDYGGEGPPIVLVHGVLGNAWMWSGVAGRLTGHGRVIALDLRGYGDSQWSVEGADPTTAHASDLAGLADAHGWPSITLVGFSLGGLVGLALWELRPELVTRLVMVDLAPSSTRTETDVQPIPMTVAGHAEAVAVERAGLPHTSDELVEVMAGHGWRPGTDGMLVRKHHPGIASRWRFRSEDWWHTVDRFEPPLLFVHAPDSPVCPPAEAGAVAERARRGHMVAVSGSGHLIPLEQPDAFVAHVIEFLDDSVA